jgi:hypothetical protein
MKKAKFAIFKCSHDENNKVTATSIKKAIKCSGVYEVIDSFSVKQKDKNISTLDVYDINSFRHNLRFLVPGNRLFMFSEDANSSMLGIKYVGKLHSICTISPKDVKLLEPCLARFMDVVNMRNQLETATYNAREFAHAVISGIPMHGDWTGKLDDKQKEFFKQFPQRIDDLHSELNGNLANLDEDIGNIINNGWE